MAELAGALAHAADAGAAREPATRRAAALVVRARAAVAAAGGRMAPTAPTAPTAPMAPAAPLRRLRLRVRRLRRRRLRRCRSCSIRSVTIDSSRARNAFVLAFIPGLPFSLRTFWTPSAPRMLSRSPESYLSLPYPLKTLPFPSFPLSGLRPDACGARLFLSLLATLVKDRPFLIGFDHHVRDMPTFVQP